MRNLPLVALPAVLALAACGDTDEASTAAEADTVEMPADDAFADIDEGPVADPAATAPEPAGPIERDVAMPNEREQEAAEASGERAAEVAAEAQRAAEEATNAAMEAGRE